MTKSVQIVELGSIDAVERDQWATLLDHSPDASVFQTQGWMRAWWNVFGASRFGLRLFAAIEDNRIVGLAPLMQTPSGTAARDRRVTFVGEEHSDYLTFLAWDGSQAIINRLLDHIVTAVPKEFAIRFDQVPQRSALATCLDRRQDTLVSDVTPCPRIALADNESWVKELFQKNSVRRNSKRLRSLGPVAVEHFTDIAAIEPLLSAFFEQHIERCKSATYGSLFSNPENQQFYRALVGPLASSGNLVFTVVYLSGRPIAHHFGFEFRQEFTWYKPSFDPSMAKYSPGEVLLLGLIEHALDRGCTVFDFTRGDESFKSRFASEIRCNRSYVCRLGAWQLARARIGARLRRLVRPNERMASRHPEREGDQKC